MLTTDTRTFSVDLPPASPPRLGIGPTGIFAAGEILAERFRIVRLVGQGGMGQVFEAYDLELGTSVAIKAVRPEYSKDPLAIRRFKSEVHLARQVTHPNVCRIFDLFQHRQDSGWGQGGGALFFLTMELLDGEPLSERLLRGPLPHDEAVTLLQDLAGALDAAHGAGIVHRDLKSSNIMLVAGEFGPRAVITDFGLASIGFDLDAAAAATSPREAKIGTPAYMAPEVLAGEEATAAADLYALGLVLHEMLTGSRPSPVGERRQLDAALPPAWRPVLERLLEVRPQRRFRRASGALDALARHKRRQRGRWLLAALCLVSVLMLTGDRQPIVEASGLEPRSSQLEERRLPPLEQPSPEHLAMDRIAAPARELYARGLEQLRLEDHVAARDTLRSAVRAETENPLIRIALSRAFVGLGADRAAREAAWSAWELAIDLPELEQLEVEAYYRRTSQDWPRALELHRQLRQRSPERLDYGLDLAIAEMAAGEKHAAFQTFDQLQRQAQSALPRLRVDLAHARALLQRPDFSAARSIAERAAQSAEELGEPQLAASALLVAAEASWQQGRPDEASARVEQARSKLIESDTENRLLEVLRLQGNIALSRYHLEEAVTIYQNLFRRADELGHRFLLGVALHNGGLVRMRLGDLRGMRESMQHFLRLKPLRGNDRSRILVLCNLASLASQLGELDDAERLADEIIEAARQAEEPMLEALARGIRGQIFFDRGKIEEASREFGETRRRYEALGTRARVGMTRLAETQILIEDGRLTEAATILETLSEQMRTRGEIDVAVYGLARLELIHGRPDRALSRVEPLVRSFEEKKDRLRLADVYAFQAKCHLEAGRHRQAIASLERARGLLPEVQALRQRMDFELIGARLLARDEGRRTAQAVLEEATSLGLPLWQLEARKILAEIELETNQPAALTQLEQVARDAENRGYLRLAQQARRLASKG